MIVELIGWVGTILIVLAYYLVTSDKLRATGHTYNWMNLGGAVCIGANVFSSHAYPAVALQLVWGFVAVSGLLKNYSRKRKRTRTKTGGGESLERLGGVLQEPDAADS